MVGRHLVFLAGKLLKDGEPFFRWAIDNTPPMSIDDAKWERNIGDVGLARIVVGRKGVNLTCI